MTTDKQDHAVGALVGLAVGDAIGTTLEFTRRGAQLPLTDMVGGGPFLLTAGQWTDDTAMALCLADSLLAKNAVDAADLSDRFVRWWRNGENSCTGTCFDIGSATVAALGRYERTGDPRSGNEDPGTAGNGSLMRLSPVAIRWHHDAAAARPAARAQSEPTHRAPAALDACGWFAERLVAAIGGIPKAAVLACHGRQDLVDEIAAIAAGSWGEKERQEISSSGYVVHSLEAAMWAVARSDGFEEAVLLAANLGNDADTVAAITGQLAGALWGVSGIPESWLDRLAWRDRIELLALDLYRAGLADADR
ncbi:MAG: ADP-ribosylglycohydrolase family protein [Woeseia sp.]